MPNSAWRTQKLADDEQVVAQSPSQGCCTRCQKALGTPDDDGQRMTIEEDYINEKIPELSPRGRTAFAIGCAERALPVTDWYFGPKQRPNFDKAIELCWSHALGNSVAKGELKKAEKHWDATADRLYDKGEEGSPYLFAVMAILLALQSISQPEAKVAQKSVSYSRGVAAGEDRPELHDTHMQEEAVWQVLALDVALAKAEPSRDMFQQLPTDPNWLKSFRARKPPRPAGQ
jgi:hypothetical protein